MPKKAIKNSAEQTAKELRRRALRIKIEDRYTDRDRLDALEAWLIQGEGDDLLDFRFDAKAKRVRVNNDAGGDLRSAIDTFIERNFGYTLLLDDMNLEELKNFVQARSKKVRAQRKKRSKRT